MSASCYYEEGGRPVGPLTPEALRELARRGAIQPGTSAWVTGAPAWQTFAEWEVAQNAVAIPSSPPSTPVRCRRAGHLSELRLAAPRVPAAVPAAKPASDGPKAPSAFAAGLATCRKCGKPWARAHLNEQRPDGPVCRACEAKERQESAEAAAGSSQNVTCG